MKLKGEVQKHVREFYVNFSSEEYKDLDWQGKKVKFFELDENIAVTLSNDQLKVVVDTEFMLHVSVRSDGETRSKAVDKFIYYFDMMDYSQEAGEFYFNNDKYLFFEISYYSYIEEKIKKTI